MRNYFNCMLSVACILFIACRQPKGYTTVDEFPVTQKMECQEVAVSPNLFLPVGLVLLDKAVVVLNMNSEVFFQVFERPSFKHLGDFVRYGNGAGEDSFVDPYIQRLSGNQFLYRNLTGVKIAAFDDAVGNLRIVEELNFFDELPDLFHVIKSGNQLIGTRYDVPTQQEFVAYDIAGKTVKDFGEGFPDVDYRGEIPEKYKMQLFAKAMALKPDGSRFACVYDKFPILRIYDMKGELLHDVRLQNRQEFPIALVKDKPTESEYGNIMQNYRMIKATDRFIYALYIGKTVGEMSPGMNDFSKTIHVWDWNGTPKARLVLDHDIFTFAVSDDDRSIIAVSLEHPKHMFQYKMEQLLN